MATKIIMPQLGESVVEGTVTKWLKKEGESIEEFEALLEVNTDKVDTEIPSPAGGLLLKILVPEGTTVKAGTLLAWVGQPGEVVDGGEPPVQPVKATAAVPQTAVVMNSPVVSPSAKVQERDLGFISPVVARMAKEYNLDLQQVTGTGEGGRITKKDVLAHLDTHQKTAPVEAPAWETPGEGDLFRPAEIQFASNKPTPAPLPASPLPAAATSAAGGGRLIPHTAIRRAIAAHMLHTVQTSAHVTTVMEANLQKVVAHREANLANFARDGAKLTYTPYFIAAIVAGLKAFPTANSTWLEDGIFIHDAINIGMAVSLNEEGLIVPVIKHADSLSLLGLARSVNDLGQRARAHRLLPDEVKSGTFSITNHGISGSLFATPLINQPQCAILGVGAVQKRAVVIQDAIAIRPMVYLSLTFDHRILDGSGADGFLAAVVNYLENWA